MQILKNILLITLLLTALNAKELEKVSLQLMWLDQFQFAGYYMAKEKGFYKDIGLEVEFKKFHNGINIVEDVMSAKTTYGIGRSSLIIERSNGLKLKLLASVFQSTPLILLSRKDSQIKTIQDFKSKRIMTTKDAAFVASIVAMMKKEGISLSDMHVQKHSFNIQDLIDRKTDLMAGYISNEPYYLKKKGVACRVYDPKDYGFDFYSDILFTSDAEVKTHEQRTRNFLAASMKGWEYAFTHIDETVDIILKRYNAQNKSRNALIFEAQALKKLAYYKTDSIGSIDIHKIQRIYDIYNISGLAKHKIDIKHLVFDLEKDSEVHLTQEEKEYIKNNRVVKICTLPNVLPYSTIQNGEFIGMSADFLKIVQKKVNLEFRLVPTKNVMESISSLRSGKCELIPALQKNENLGENIIFSKTFYKASLVVVTKVDKYYISNIKTILDKKIAIVKGYSQISYFKNKYPNIKIVAVKNVEEGLKKVADASVYAFIGNLEPALYEIRKNHNNKLMINGNLEAVVSVGMAIRNDNPTLVSILNKAIVSVSEYKKNQIVKEWLNTKYEKIVDYSLVWQLLILFTIILIVILLFVLRQNSLKRKIEVLNNSLEDKVAQQVQEIEKSVNMFETIFDTVKDGIAILDLQSNFILVNKAYEGITGYTKKELYETSCIALSSPDMVETSKEIVALVVNDGYYYGYKKQCILKDGSYIDVNLDLILMNDKQNILMVTKDITLENKFKYEKSLQEQQMFQQSKLAQMGEMISMIAHQWRQPLGAIASTTIDLQVKMELEVFDIQTEQGREKAIAYFTDRLKNIEMLTQSLTSTIDDFRDFYKPSKMFEKTNIYKPISKALDIIKVSLTTDNIELKEYYNSKKELGLYNSELMQVMLNIFKNAQDNFKYKGIKNAYIKIETEDTPDGIRVDICDNGGGISEEIIEKIFNPYFSTKDEKNGTGLGLYMSKMIIEEHHAGSFNVKNTDEGVCFSILLSSLEESSES